LHNEALADRNWNCRKPSNAPAACLNRGDLIVQCRDAEGCITFVNDAYCELAQRPRAALIGGCLRI
jgi:PAS domain-containing protein